MHIYKGQKLILGIFLNRYTPYVFIQCFSLILKLTEFSLSGCPANARDVTVSTFQCEIMNVHGNVLHFMLLLGICTQILMLRKHSRNQAIFPVPVIQFVNALIKQSMNQSILMISHPK